MQCIMASQLIRYYVCFLEASFMLIKCEYAHFYEYSPQLRGFAHISHVLGANHHCPGFRCTRVLLCTTLCSFFVPDSLVPPAVGSICCAAQANFVTTCVGMYGTYRITPDEWRVLMW